MAQQQYTRKEGQGSLFRNNNKTNDNQPDWSGTVLIGGVEKRVALWSRVSQNGNEYFSVNVRDDQTQQQGQQQTRQYDTRNWREPAQAAAPMRAQQSQQQRETVAAPATAPAGVPDLPF